MQNYFHACRTLDDIKKLYRELAKQHHPDKGGDLLTMQLINAQYATAIKNAAKGEGFTAEQVDAEILSAEAYKEAVNKVINLEGITVELIGSWLWITGETRQHKDILKAEPAKFTWAKKKDDFSAWFFRTAENATSNKGQKMQLDNIRTKYGSMHIAGTKRSFINN